MRSLRKLWPRRRSDNGLACACCGKGIDGTLPAMAYVAPTYWDDSSSAKKGNYLDSDFCVIDNESFFVRAVVLIPIVDSDEHFQWGVWVSLSEKNFKRYHKVYGTDKELAEEPYFGWFSNQIPTYPDCLKIKTTVILKGGGLRPEIILDHDNPHPLCQEQHSGITRQRAQEIVETLIPQA